MIVHLITAGQMENPSNWPEIWHKCYKSWENCPYEIKMWRDSDINQLLKEDDKEFFSILNTLHPIYKWDYVRYIILEKFGGAYFDMDVEITDPSFLYKLKKDEIYISEGNWNSSLSNHIMISSKTPYSDLIWDSIKETSKNIILNNLDKCKNNPNNSIYTSGPIFLSNYSSRWSFKYSKLGWPQFSSIDSKLSYSKHHETSYWLKT
jgi:mannosyltransferase OCH1-like enzyme